jgi:hypothetical protein
MPTQASLRLRGAIEAIDKTARYVNEVLYASKVINRDQQHELLWGLRIAHLAVNQQLTQTPLWEGSDEPMSKGVPLDF